MHVLFSHPTFVFVMPIYLTKITINYLNNQLTICVWSGVLLVNKLHPFLEPRNTLLCLHGFTPGSCLQLEEFIVDHTPGFCV